jgi:hypothetical protein
MKQALNFADNQILEIYGISTASWTGKVKHMRNDSAYLLDLRSGMDNMQMHL